MKSHEMFQQLFKKHSAKQVAAGVGLSLSAVERWARTGEGHRTDPAERLGQVMRSTGDREPLHWLCAEMDGTFVENAPAKPSVENLMRAENETVREMAALLKTIAEATEDNQITPAEAASLRLRWEKLKPVVEGFVQACERGAFRCGAFFLSLGWWFATGDVLVIEAV